MSNKVQKHLEEVMAAREEAHLKKIRERQQGKDKYADRKNG